MFGTLKGLKPLVPQSYFQKKDSFTYPIVFGVFVSFLLNKADGVGGKYLVLFFLLFFKFLHEIW